MKKSNIISLIQYWLLGPGYDTCLRYVGYFPISNLVAFKISISKKTKKRERKLLEELILKLAPYYTDSYFKIQEDSLSANGVYSLELIDGIWSISFIHLHEKDVLKTFGSLSEAIEYIFKNLSYQ